MNCKEAARLFRSDFARPVLLIARCLNHLRHIRQAFAALGPPAAPLEDFGNAACAAARRSEFAIFESIANAHIHERRDQSSSRRNQIRPWSE